VRYIEAKFNDPDYLKQFAPMVYKTRSSFMNKKNPRASSVMMTKMTGLTLIEVLIALAIVAIALTAVIKAASQNIRSTAYLQHKTIAMWVGRQVLNEIRVGALKLPEEGDKTEQATTMLGQNWRWQAEQKPTPNNRIKKIEVNVFAGDKAEGSPLISLESYVYEDA